MSKTDVFTCEICYEEFSRYDPRHQQSLKIFRLCRECLIDALKNNYRTVIQQNPKAGIRELLLCLPNDIELLSSIGESAIKLDYENDKNDINTIMSRIDFSNEDEIYANQRVLIECIEGYFTLTSYAALLGVLAAGELNETEESLVNMLVDMFMDVVRMLDSQENMRNRLMVRQCYLQLYDTVVFFMDCIANVTNKNTFVNAVGTEFTTLVRVTYGNTEEMSFNEVMTDQTSKVLQWLLAGNLSKDTFAARIDEMLSCVEESHSKINNIDEQLINKYNDLKSFHVANIGRCSCGNGVIKEETSTKFHQCSECDKLWCGECLCEINEEERKSGVHTCNKEDIETVKELKANSRNCPVCGIWITRKSGCPDMFCTNCKTMFNYETGNIIHGNRHNPERIAYLESINQKDDRFNMLHGEVNAAVKLIGKFNDDCTDTIFLMYQLATDYVNNIDFFIKDNNRALATDIEKFINKYINFSLFTGDMIIDDALMFINDSFKTRMLMIYWLLQRESKLLDGENRSLTTVLLTTHERQLFYISYLAICVFNYLYRRISISEELCKLIINIQQRIYACVNADNDEELKKLIFETVPKLFEDMLSTLVQKYKSDDKTSSGPIVNYGNFIFKLRSNN